MSLKWVGFVIAMVGVIQGPFFILGTTGAREALTGTPLAVFALAVISALVGNILSLRGTNKLGGGLTLVSGLVCIGLYFATGKAVSLFPGGLFVIGGLLAFLYRAPIPTGSQWQMRRSTGGPPPAS